MKKLIFFACLVCLFFTSCSLLDIFRPNVTTIVEGIVVSDSTNLPVEGISVSFTFFETTSVFPSRSNPIDDNKVFTDKEGRYKMSKTSKAGEIDDILIIISSRLDELGYDDFISDQQVGSRISIGDRNEINFRLLKR